MKMSLDQIDEIIEKVVRKRPGCTARILSIIVCKRFPVETKWPTRSSIAFMSRRSKLIAECLRSSKYENRGRANKHRWYIKDD